MRCVVDQRGLESVSIDDFVNNRVRSDNRSNYFMDHCLVNVWTDNRVCGFVMSSKSLSSFLCNFWFVLLFLLFMGFLLFMRLLVVDFVMKGSFADKSIIIVHLENKVAIFDINLA